MIKLNDFFGTKPIMGNNPKISLCGKLEAIIGNYFLYGAGTSDDDFEVLYYDSKVGFYDCVDLIKENIVAYITADEKYMFVLENMREKIQQDTEEYGLIYISVNSFDDEELYIDQEMELPDFLKHVLWVDDDFMNDGSIPFDFSAFDIIDSGKEYVNPKHFSVSTLFKVLKSV
ncbi:MAG: hypothetical protein ACI4F0_04075 [Agathobacter sp.]